MGLSWRPLLCNEHGWGGYCFQSTNNPVIMIDEKVLAIVPWYSRLCTNTVFDEKSIGGLVLKCLYSRERTTASMIHFLLELSFYRMCTDTAFANSCALSHIQANLYVWSISRITATTSTTAKLSFTHFCNILFFPPCLTSSKCFYRVFCRNLPFRGLQ